MVEEPHLKSQSLPPTVEAEKARYLLSQPPPAPPLKPGLRCMAWVCLAEAGTVPDCLWWQRAQSGVQGQQ